MQDQRRTLSVEGCCCHSSHFTLREIEVLSLVALGMITGDIAARLQISKRTVEAHLAAMLRRSGAHTRAELVAICYACGIFTPAVWPPVPSGRCCLNVDAEAVSDP